MGSSAMRIVTLLLVFALLQGCRGVPLVPFI